MKKMLSLILTAVLMLLMLSSCTLMESFINPYGYVYFGDGSGSGNFGNSTSSSTSSSTGSSSGHVHSWSEASCLSPATCTKCGATQGRKAAHDYRVEQQQAATCKQEGFTVSSCSVCHVQQRETIPVASHTPGADYRCTTCSVLCFTGTAHEMLRTEAVKITLSGRIKQQCDVVDIDKYYDFDYLRSNGFKSVRVTVSMTIDVNRKGTQLVLLYPTSLCAEGAINELLTGDPNVLYCYKSSHDPSVSGGSISFTTDIPLAALSEERLYIRYDAHIGSPLPGHQWSNANVSISVTPV